ncbi:MAG: hypothetical protein ACREPL_13060 [Rhodanobacteraceae bacterium]
MSQHVIECDANLEALLAPLQRHTVNLTAVSQTRTKHASTFDARQALARWAGVDLTRIDELGVVAG